MNPDREHATRAAQRAYREAIKAGLAVTLDDDLSTVTVTIRYAAEAEDEPDFTQLEARARRRDSARKLPSS